MKDMQIKKSSKMTFFLSMPKHQNLFIFMLFKSWAIYYTDYKFVMHVRHAYEKKFKNDFFSINAKAAKFLSF